MVHRKVQIQKAIANLLWVANKLSNLQSLKHTAVASRPIWLCAFGSVTWLHTPDVNKTRI